MNITVGSTATAFLARLVRASETEFVCPEIDVKYRRLEFASRLVLKLKTSAVHRTTDFSRD